MRYPTCQQLPRLPAHGHTCDVASPTKKPIVKVADEETAYESYMNPEPGLQSGPGDSVDKRLDGILSASYKIQFPSGGGLRKVAVGVKEAQATEETIGSDMVAKGMI